MIKMNKVLIIITLLLMTFTWTACSNADNSGEEDTNSNGDTSVTETTYPLTITDDLGNEVTFEKAPEKIVSVSPGITETLFELGLGENIIGRDGASDYPKAAQDLEIVGDYKGPNTELIIDLAPEVVFAYESIPEDVNQLLEASNIKVVVFNPTNVDGVLENIKQVGVITNKQTRANELIESMSAKRTEILEKVKDVDQKKVFMDLGDFISVGPNTFINSILEEANAINIASDSDTPWPTLSIEKIIEDNPDVYISTYTSVEDIKSVVGIDVIEAYKNDNIIVIPWGTEEHNMIQRPGPRVVEGLEIYANTIYPELFE
ncbi:ABC transporter substrate-binding protein [Alkalibaculum sp. M08DMB]|uniref:ABC transporter substrate-binding protein n=1 Tax=Alkalibaculum sporogenes TaxID=2655001 RepID=A0A6A7KC59_9FIRM|nr:ABC transporter substrate-binding protein [Alkalibaculum sporogenes]MPW26935.1 ABC transporter substrate-binding protein [Alkalibaculum sporogenes]